MKWSIFSSFVLLTITKFSLCVRLNEQIYSSIQGSAACFRRLNGTHQSGCTSTQSGTVGVVLMVKDYSDAQWLVFNSSAGPYMAVVSTAQFQDVIELFMTKPDNVAGVLLFENATQRIDVFTQESQCPNQYASAPGSSCPQSNGFGWNKWGTGLLRRDIPFPIFYLPESRIEEIEKIEKCHDKFNLDRDNQKGMPLCSVQMNSFMFAAVDTNVCMRRSAASTILKPAKLCDPLGDNNVYYSLFPRAKETNTTKKSVTLVTARIDSASLFDGLAPGAASSVISMVSLITAAATLSKMIPITEADKYSNNILWTLFNGEAFDYIGSQRVAYDLSRGAWPHTPLAVEDIKLHVELGQLGGSLSDSIDSRWLLNSYAPYTSNVPAKITEFLSEMYNRAQVYNQTINSVFDLNLPPSSLHSFRRILKTATESGDLPELVLVDHNETFTNKYYHSVMDDDKAVDFVYRNISIGSNGTFMETSELLSDGTMKDSDMQVKMSRLATALSQTLYQQVTGVSYAGNITASAHLVDELLHCFLQTQSCRILQSADYAGGGRDVADRPAPLYVGVAAWGSPPPVFAGHMLALLTGTNRDTDKKGCDGFSDPDFSYYWLRGWDLKGACIETTMNFSQAISPAFVIQDYDLSSGLYSSWTESVWQSMWARVFVAGGGGGARAGAGAGALATLLAAAATYWLRRHAASVFPHQPPDQHAGGGGILRSVNC